MGGPYVGKRIEQKETERKRGEEIRGLGLKRGPQRSPRSTEDHRELNRSKRRGI